MGLRNTLYSIILAIGLSSCTAKVEKEIFSGKIDDNEVVLYEKESIGLKPLHYRKIVVYDKSRKLSKVMYDADGDGFNVRGFEDYVQTFYPDGKSTKIGLYFTDKEGKKFHFERNPDPLAKIYSEKREEEFNQANNLYRRVLESIAKKKTS